MEINPSRIKPLALINHYCKYAFSGTFSLFVYISSAASSDKSGVSRAFSPKNGKSGSQRSSAVVNPPFKKKMTQVEPEPKHEVVEGSSRDVELYYSVVSDYSKFKIDSQNGTDIHFKDTLMFQSRIYE